MKTVNRKGRDTIKTEEVETPRRAPKNGPSTSEPHQTSSSPTKRPKLDPLNDEHILFNMDGVDASGKKKTLVFVVFFMQRIIF